LYRQKNPKLRLIKYEFLHLFFKRFWQQKRAKLPPGLSPAFEIVSLTKNTGLPPASPFNFFNLHSTISHAVEPNWRKLRKRIKTIMKTVAIIRDRGQLTIPDIIRESARWTSTSSVVSIVYEKPGEIVITPHQATNESYWDKLFDSIKKSRNIKGKGGISASVFITNDRS
jgi:bifunctional DNA-binding transcriptional regulator/antitoxin component of YhaV-PrlF toxin-antitoxin module